ncbi:MAG: radical SAM protein [Nanoarchaeota archaeon]|nr:radical SAM protein [Nanoarchaeota archaeon]
MKVVLLSPPGEIEKTIGKYFKKFATSTPPLGLAYIAATLLKGGHDIKVIDAYAEGINFEETCKRVINEKPDAVAVTVVTPNAPISHKIAARIKHSLPNTYILFGGAHPSIKIKETLEDKSVDFVVKGEGELVFPELLSALQNNDDIKKIKGVSFREDGEIVINPDKEILENLDELPYPAWELFPMQFYVPYPHWFLKTPFFPMLTSRGCVFRCNYCSLTTLGRKRRARDPMKVVDEIEWLVNKFGAREIMFMDPMFPFNKKHDMKIFDEIIRRGLNKKIVWISETRVTHVDEESLKKMYESGCRRIAYGAESGVQELLDNVKKDQTVEQIRRAFAATKKAKIDIIAYMMLGLPGETKELSLQTIKFAKEIEPEFVKFNLTIPFPGTELYDTALEQGKLRHNDYAQFTSLSGLADSDPIYVPDGYSVEELKKIQKRAYREYYLRPKILIKHLFKLRSFRDVTTGFNGVVSLIKGVVFQ